MRTTAAAALAVIAALGIALAAERAAPDEAKPPGEDTSLTTDALALGAKVLQTSAPLSAFDVHLVGFHPMKDEPGHQMLSHHFCEQVNEDFAQCVLFDGDGADANLNGVEFIVSEKLFERLPAEERELWHPHNHEILSGELVAPGIPEAAEMRLMKSKINSYGKTWHFWETGVFRRPRTDLPTGPARLAWSTNRDGEVLPGLLAKRDEEMGVDTARRRAARAELARLARPQEGVDALKDAFPGAGGRPEGVAPKPAH